LILATRQNDFPGAGIAQPHRLEVIARALL
jgi:hypothetical protein